MDESTAISTNVEKSPVCGTVALHHFVELLGQLRELTPGWDSYDAPPPSEIACDLVELILLVLKMHRLPVSSLVPTTEGGLLLTHRVKSGQVSWEVDDDGEIGVVVQSGEGEPILHSPTDRDIVQLIANLAGE